MDHITTRINSLEVLTPKYDIIARNNYHRQDWIKYDINPKYFFADADPASKSSHIIRVWIKPTFLAFLREHNIILNVHNERNSLFRQFDWSFEFSGSAKSITELVLKWF